MPKPSVSPSFIVVNTMMIWLTVGISAAALWPIYESAHLIVLSVVSLVAGSAVAIAGLIYRWSSTVVMLIAIAVFLVIGVPLGVPEAALFGILPTPEGFYSLLAATALGWKQLVTITLPVGTFEALFVPALILLFFGTVIGLSVALRTKYGEVATVVPVLIFVAAVALGSPVTDWPFPFALALLGSVLVWHIWARWYRRRAAIQLLISEGASHSPKSADSGATRLGFRAIIGAALIMALAMTMGAAALSLFPVTTDRQVLRTVVEKPFDPGDYASPLSAFRSNLQEPLVDGALFTVAGLPEGGRIRIATLDNYDGVVFSVGGGQRATESGVFERIPTSFDQSRVQGLPVTVTIELERYQGIWLPTVGNLESVSFSGNNAVRSRSSLFYNNNSGTAVVTSGLSAGMTYALHAVIPDQPQTIPWQTLEPGPAIVPAPELLPEDLALKLNDYTGQTKDPGDKLRAMVDGLRSDGYISHGVDDDEPTSRSGHGADRITQLVTDQQMIGDAEQYAVTAALMAGELGFPARVVYGFAPQTSGGSEPIVVRGSDVSAWIEVNTNRFGWVTIDPNPEPRPIPEQTPDEAIQVARPQTPVQPPPTEPDFLTDQVPPESVQEAPPAIDPVLELLLKVARAIGWVLLSVLILLAPFVTIAIAKGQRRRLRKRARTPLARVSGGWNEFEDAVRDHGFTPPQSPTRTEVAQTVGGTRALVLASVVDKAVFSPDETDDKQADRVWRAVDELREALDEGRTVQDRIRAVISLRSLGGYSVKSLFVR